MKFVENFKNLFKRLFNKDIKSIPQITGQTETTSPVTDDRLNDDAKPFAEILKEKIQQEPTEELLEKSQKEIIMQLLIEKGMSPEFLKNPRAVDEITDSLKKALTKKDKDINWDNPRSYVDRIRHTEIPSEDIKMNDDGKLISFSERIPYYEDGKCWDPHDPSFDRGMMRRLECMSKSFRCSSYDEKIEVRYES